MIFRIEDTDSQRFVPGAEAYIIEALEWLGIKFDEGVSYGGNYGPYRQSERKDIYRKYVNQLLDAGKAYIAFDTPAELEAKRNEIANFQYDASTRMQMRNSLTMDKEEVDSLIAQGQQYVVRFKIEPGEYIVVDDLIRGEVTINSSILDDKVLYKSADNLPTYHLANIVDDHLMLGLPRNPWRRVVALGSVARIALPGFRLGRHHAAVRPFAPVVETRR